jgi:hypothetical protein
MPRIAGATAASCASPSVTIRRGFRNNRGDRFRRRIRLGRGDERGIHASSVDVVSGNIVLTPHREGGRGVPAP